MKITYHGHSCLTIEMENAQPQINDTPITGQRSSDLPAEVV